MKSIGTAVESYMTDHYIAPSSLDNAGFGNYRAFHIKKFPPTDSWGGQWFYVRDASFQDIYSIGSGGRDNSTVSTWTNVGEYIVNSLPDFNNDIIYSNGAFVYGPKVK